MTRRPGWTPGALRLANLRAHPDRLKVDNAAGSDGSDTATVLIYDEISWCGVTADAVAHELDGITASAITVRLNSPGGDLFDGIAIYNSLVSHPASVTVQVDGLAASAASVIAMAGESVRMMAGAQLMVHDGMALCIGNAADMVETAALLDKCSDQVAGFYARRAGGAVADWRAIMRGEAWYTGPEAVAAGLADEAVADADDEPTKDGPTARFDLSVFNYAGRDKAPSPPPVPTQPMRLSVPPLFDPAAFHADRDRARQVNAARDYGELLRIALGRQ